MNLSLKAIVASLALMLSAPALAETIHGRVVGVSDGDTLTLLAAGNQQIKVRLAGIDAPEKAQDFGQVSKKSLSDLVFNQVVQVNVEDTDRYGRSIGWVNANGLDVNAAQVQRGMAWVYRRYINTNQGYGRNLVVLETAARTKGIGLWSGYNPVAPWEFRRVAREGE